MQDKQSKPVVLTRYAKAIEDKEFVKLMQADNRFKDIDERKDRSDLPPKAWLSLAVTSAYLVHWKGLLCNKSPMEMTLYPMLLNELKPKTIIEIGAFHGGSALWLADMMTSFAIDGSIISIDIDLSMIESSVKKDKRITFIEGDAKNIAHVLPISLLQKLPHPWLVIEDCHINTQGILDHFHQNGFNPGDYMIVEDTNIDALTIRHDPNLGNLYLTEKQIAEKSKKMKILRKWLQKTPGYKVDTFYLDMFGYNASKNWNSVLKRVMPSDAPHATLFKTSVGKKRLSDKAEKSDDTILTNKLESP